MEDMTDLFAALAEAKASHDNGGSDDLLAIVDAVIDATRRRHDGIRVIVAKWHDDWGHCSDCGLPAAFHLTYSVNGVEHAPDDTDKRCSVCAANAAVDGETVRRIDADWDQPHSHP
jgi:hypothetical protein